MTGARAKVLGFHAVETVEATVSLRTRFPIALQLGALLALHGAAFAQHGLD